MGRAIPQEQTDVLDDVLLSMALDGVYHSAAVARRLAANPVIGEWRGADALLHLVRILERTAGMSPHPLVPHVPPE